MEVEVGGSTCRAVPADIFFSPADCAALGLLLPLGVEEEVVAAAILTLPFQSPSLLPSEAEWESICFCGVSIRYRGGLLCQTPFV